MAILNFTGFESGDAVAAESTSGTFSIQSSVVRTGGYSLQVNPTAASAYYRLRGLAANGAGASIARTAATYYAFWLRFATLPAANTAIASVNTDAGVAVVEVKVASSGALTLVGATTSSTVATLSTGVWYLVEVECVSNGTSACRVNVGTEQTCTAANQTQGLLTLGNSAATGTYSAYYDDIAISSTDWLGTVAVKMMAPDGAGSSTAWTGAYTDVDEVPHDSDTTFLTSSTSGQVETVSVASSASSGIVEPILSVKTHAVVRDAGGVSLVAVRLGGYGGSNDSTSSDPGSSYVLRAKLYDANPSGSVAWTTSTLDSLEVGVNNAANVAVRCTSLALMVLIQNSPPTITVAPDVTYVAGFIGVALEATPATITFTATDPETTGAGDLTWAVYTGTGGTGSVVHPGGAFTSGVEVEFEIESFASGLILGEQTLYLRVWDDFSPAAYTEAAFSFFKYAVTLEGDFNLSVALFDASGAAVGDGPLINLLACTYSAHLGQIGSFAFSVPTTDDRSAILDDAHGYTVHITRAGEGLVFKGLIDRIQDMIGADESKVREVSGSSVGRELVHANTYATAVDNVSLSSAVGTLLTGTDWVAGSVGSPAINITARFDLRTVWDALAQAAQMAGYYLREDVLNRQIDINAFGTNPNGLVFRNVEMVTQELQENRRMIPITGIQVLGGSADVWNRIIPLGQREGISGESLTLEHSTRATPYTVASDTAQDGSTYWYIEDATSVTAYGRRVKPLLVTKIVPLGIGANDEERAANALYDNASTWLARHKDPLTTYQVSVLGLRHLDDGVQLIECGDKVRLQYRGVALDEAGRRTFLDVDSDLFIMGYTRRMQQDGRDEWSFSVSTVARGQATDETMISDMYQTLQSVQATQLPFVIFGEGAFRMDESGIQFATSTLDTAITRGIHFIDGAFVADPTSANAYVSIYGFQGTDGEELTIEHVMDAANGRLAKIVLRDWLAVTTNTYVQVLAQDNRRTVGHRQTSIEMLIDTSLEAAWINLNAPDGVFVNGPLSLGSGATLTIATGAITVTGGFHAVDTQSAAATDDLDTINGGAEGQTLVIIAANSARTVSVTEAGNIKLSATPYALDNTEDTLTLIKRGATWLEQARSNNGA